MANYPKIQMTDAGLRSLAVRLSTINKELSDTCKQLNSRYVEIIPGEPLSVKVCNANAELYKAWNNMVNTINILYDVNGINPSR